MTNKPLETRSSQFKTLRAYLELARPANVVTAWADVLAGIAAAVGWLHFHDGPQTWTSMLASLDFNGVLLLVVSTTGLYAGGVIFNDVFDARLDAVERPERAIPSGRASKLGAMLFGSTMLILGIVSAWASGGESGMLAVLIAGAALLYDRFSKHHAFFGPLNMGLCRGANLLLGVSSIPAALNGLWVLGLLPIIYIAAITSISQREVHGGTQQHGRLALALVFMVVLAISGLAVWVRHHLFIALPFIGLFAWMVIPAFSRASRVPEPANIKRAVKAGVLGLIPLNAALAVSFSSWPVGVIILLLLPISIGLARMFAVT